MVGETLGAPTQGWCGPLKELGRASGSEAEEGKVPASGRDLGLGLSPCDVSDTRCPVSHPGQFRGASPSEHLLSEGPEPGADFEGT